MITLSMLPLHLATALELPGQDVLTP